LSAVNLRARRSLAAIGIGLVTVAGAACGSDGPPVAAGSASASVASVASGPRLGACYDTPVTLGSMWSDRASEVSCTVEHLAETYHTGTVDVPSDAAQVQPGSQQLFDLFATCEAKANEFLGGAWSGGRIALLVTLPRPDAWAAGARGYSCDAAEVDQIGGQVGFPAAAVRRSSSLRGALAVPGPLAMACFRFHNPPVTLPQVPVPCDQPHDTEYAGAFTGTLPLPPNNEAAHDYAEDRCRGVVAAYIGSKNNGGIRPGWLEWSRTTWDTGLLTVRCFALPATEGKRFTASVKGIGRRSPATVNA
jgi:Septum formation